MVKITANTINELKKIAETLRRLPESMGIDGPEWKCIDIGAAAGRLMRKAMEHGLYQDIDHLELRIQFQMVEEGEAVYQRQSRDGVTTPPPPWHEFTCACIWLWKQAGIGERVFDRDFARDGCNLIASTIDELIESLEMDKRSSKRSRGRPRISNGTQDTKIFDCWSTGEFKTYADLGRELGMTDGDVRRALDRQRKSKSR